MNVLAQSIEVVYREKVTQIAKNLDMKLQTLEQFRKDDHYSKFRACQCEYCTMTSDEFMSQQKRYAVKAVEEATRQRNELLELISQSE